MHFRCESGLGRVLLNKRTFIILFEIKKKLYFKYLYFSYLKDKIDISIIITDYFHPTALQYGLIYFHFGFHVGLKCVRFLSAFRCIICFCQVRVGFRVNEIFFSRVRIGLQVYFELNMRDDNSSTMPKFLTYASIF